MSRLSLLGLLAIASCSFDLSRSDAALADRGLDGGLPDRRLSDQAREPSPPIADRGDAETLPRITWYSSGKCAVGGRSASVVAQPQLKS